MVIDEGARVALEAERPQAAGEVGDLLGHPHALLGATGGAGEREEGDGDVGHGAFPARIGRTPL